jgi:hypothetical protein
MMTPVVAEITGRREPVTRDPFIERLGCDTNPFDQRRNEPLGGRASAPARGATLDTRVEA